VGNCFFSHSGAYIVNAGSGIKAAHNVGSLVHVE